MRTAILKTSAPGYITCECGDDLWVITTSYGFRAICASCAIRWTWIVGDGPAWTAESR